MIDNTYLLPSNYFLFLRIFILLYLRWRIIDKIKKKTKFYVLIFVWWLWLDFCIFVAIHLKIKI